MEPTLKQFRAFVAVAEAGQFTRAADVLGLSQSATSTLVSQLEGNLGLRLFDRHTRLLRLTDAGAEVLAVARQAVGDLDRLMGDLHSLKSLSRGRVGVAAGTLQAALMLPRLIRAFCAAHPGVDVSLHDVAERQVSEMVRAGQVDLGIGTVGDEDPEVAATHLLEDAFVLVVRPDHPSARRGSMRWADLGGQVLIGPQRGNPLRDKLEEELARSGTSLTLHRAFNDVSLPLTIVGLVEAGVGDAVMTSAVLPLARAVGLVALRLDEPRITRDISLLHRSDRSLSPAARQFHEFVLREARPGPRSRTTQPAATRG